MYCQDPLFPCQVDSTSSRCGSWVSRASAQSSESIRSRSQSGSKQAADISSRTPATRSLLTSAGGACALASQRSLSVLDATGAGGAGASASPARPLARDPAAAPMAPARPARFSCLASPRLGALCRPRPSAWASAVPQSGPAAAGSSRLFALLALRAPGEGGPGCASSEGCLIRLRTRQLNCIIRYVRLLSSWSRRLVRRSRSATSSSRLGGRSAWPPGPARPDRAPFGPLAL